MGVGDEARFLDRPVDGGRAIVGQRIVPARLDDCVQPAAPRHAKVVDVRPLVVDVLAESLQGVERLQRTIERGTDRVGHGDSVAPSRPGVSGAGTIQMAVDTRGLTVSGAGVEASVATSATGSSTTFGVTA